MSPFSTPCHCIIKSKIILQLKQIRQDMELLRDDKSHLEVSFDSLYLYYHIVHAGKPCQFLADVSMGH